MKFLLGGVIGAHVLAMLFAHWFVEFKCFVKYLPVAPGNATHVKVGQQTCHVIA